MDLQNKWKKWLPLILIVILAFGGYSLYSYQTVKNKKINNYQNQKDYFQSLIEDNPIPLQQAFVEKVNKNEKSSISQSQAYFIMHRFFDNGGNIYEIYDFINANPELAFLKEAEAIYPKTFELIRLRQVPNFSTRATRHAYLAYMEVLDKYGYVGVAGWGTTANLYIRLAWLAEKHPEQFLTVPKINLDKYIRIRTEKAIKYAEKIRNSVVNVLNGEVLVDVPDRDIVVMLVQYGSFLRYVESMGVKFDSPKTADEVFDFVTEYSRQYANEYYLWTVFLNASLINMVSPHRIIAMDEALDPLVSTSLKFKAEEIAPTPGSLNKIVRSKFLKYQYLPGTNIREDDYDVYGKTNVVNLAKAVPRFKEWLMKNGWEEKDFDWE